MKLIADSGGTKTAWRVIDNNGNIVDIVTTGLNPYYRSAEKIKDVIEKDLVIKMKDTKIDEIQFYGAGCSNAEGCDKIRDGLRASFPEATIEVTHDLLGVARALCKQNEGIACILGTGSNSCYYNGREIIKNIPSLGYILGDEGGGSFMGKKMLTDYLRGNIPEYLSKIFYQRFQLEKSDIEKNVYLKDNPIQFLSGFAHFILEFAEEKYMHDLIYNSFTSFLVNCIYKYHNYKDLPLHFIGGVAYNFSEILKELLNKEGLIIGNIVNNPIEELTQYHMSS
jgi:N-acetylglucosamine kinase-like BadF-type ATPase